VFKIVAAAGALEEGLVTPESRFDCSLTSIEYKGKPRGLPREDHHFGHLTVSEIISHSSNRGAAQLAMQLGDQKFYNYARAFGFGHTTGLPGGAEENGMMAPPSKWDGLTITRMPMGHSVSVTVLQMHQAMSVIASGGVLLRPQLIREIRDEKGEIVARFDRTEERRVISEATARTMARMLMGVASKEGTALEAAIPGYEVAGKTGTTQKLEPITLADGTVKQVYSARHHVASFVGFFPASRPQIVISVIVDDADAHAPGGVAYGRTVAAPAFKRIGEQLISYRDIKAGGAVVAPSFAALEHTRR
jgi:cell division protein FtsI/penicillin-binding protein 2